MRGRMLATLETVPYMRLTALERLRRFISACFVVRRTNLTWAELGCLVPFAEAAKKSRFRRWAKRGVFDRLTECSQPVAAPDVLHIDSPAFCVARAHQHQVPTQCNWRGWRRVGEHQAQPGRADHQGPPRPAVCFAQLRYGLGFMRRQLSSPGQQAEALTVGLQPRRAGGSGAYIPPRRYCVVQH